MALYAEKVQIASAARMCGKGNRIVVLGVNWLTFDFVTDVYAKIWHCVVVCLIINNDISAQLMANYRNIWCFAAFLLQTLDIKVSFLTTAERSIVHGLFIFA